MALAPKATKIANQLMKSSSNSLFGETEIDAFALALRNTFQRGAAAVLDRLTTMSDPELLAVWTAYDPENADEHSRVGFDALWRMLT